MSTTAELLSRVLLVAICLAMLLGVGTVCGNAYRNILLVEDLRERLIDVRYQQELIMRQLATNSVILSNNAYLMRNWK